METNEVQLSAGKRCKYFCKYHWHGIVLLATPILCAPLLTLKPQLEYRCCYTLCVMAVFWITEVMPLGVTSLLPIVLFPVFGIMSSNDVCFAYFKNALMMFVGSLVMALAVEHSNLHKRVALNVILIVGCSPRRLHFSLMFVTMFVSMWITNSAATAMMCPVIKAVLEELSSQGMAELEDSTKFVREDDPPYPSRAVNCFYLGVAYSASIGGLGTLIGTGTNIAFKGIYDTRFPTAEDINFLNFMMFNVPPMLVHTILTYLWLQWHFMGLFQPNSKEYQMANVGKEGIDIATQVIRDKLKEMGKFSCHEVQVGIQFILMIVLFITRKPGFFTGYADIMNAKSIKSSAPMFLVVMFLFALPVNYVFMKYWICSRPKEEHTAASLINWAYFNKRFSWNLLFLISGGFALSEGIKVSGFATLAGNALSHAENMPPSLVQLLVIIAAVIATAFTANIAMCNIMTPILIEMAVACKLHPAYLCLPACLGLSMAFHFPVSTPPNAIVAGFANLRTKDMAIGGIGPTVVTITSIFLFSQTWGFIVFPDLREFPDWAKTP